MPQEKIELNPSEWKVIRAVWEHEPCTAPDIQEKLARSTGWTYSTVRTLMDRMAAKGLLKTEKLRNLTLFRSAVTPAAAQRSALRHTLTRVFNGALTPMMQCLLESGDLSEKELAEIEALIKAKRKKRK
jgi:BlaI family penicillinase repressor